MFINTFSIEKSQNIDGQVGFNNVLRCPLFVNRQVTRNSLVRMCLVLYVFLQEIGKHCVPANVGDSVHVQQLINTKNVPIYPHMTLIMAANYGDVDFLQAV